MKTTLNLEIKLKDLLYLFFLVASALYQNYIAEKRLEKIQSVFLEQYKELKEMHNNLKEKFVEHKAESLSKMANISQSLEHKSEILLTQVNSQKELLSHKYSGFPAFWGQQPQASPDTALILKITAAIVIVGGSYLCYAYYIQPALAGFSLFSWFFGRGKGGGSNGGGGSVGPSSSNNLNDGISFSIDTDNFKGLFNKSHNILDQKILDQTVLDPETIGLLCAMSLIASGKSTIFSSPLDEAKSPILPLESTVPIEKKELSEESKKMWEDAFNKITVDADLYDVP